MRRVDRRQRTRRTRAAAIFVLLAVVIYVSDDYWPATLAERVPTADAIVVHKSARRLDLLSGGDLIKSYDISLGNDPVGHKLREGDSRTPEGFYRIDWRNEKSKFYRSLHISYPDPDDAEKARRNGVSPGGDIMIHGLPSGLGIFGGLFRGRDWTDGCIAVTSVEMAEIWAAVPNGTPIEIRP